MELSIAIQAHPTRRRQVEILFGVLRAQAEKARNAGHIVDDPIVHEDIMSAGPWESARRAWRAGTRSHHLTVQDDAVPTPGAVLAACEIAEVKPNAVVSLFYARAFPAMAARAGGHRWVSIGTFPWVVAVLMPSRIGREAVSWIEKKDDPRWHTHDDLRLGAFCRDRQVPMFASIPSVFDHLDEGSLVGHSPPMPRRAIVLAGDERVDWGNTSTVAE